MGEPKFTIGDQIVYSDRTSLGHELKRIGVVTGAAWSDVVGDWNYNVSSPSKSTVIEPNIELVIQTEGSWRSVTSDAQ
jgi:hypothetical protein